jgi:dTMP kinase
MKQGRFLVVEGLEGAGKSTALDTIAQYLRPKVPELIITREPGGTLAGEVIRTLLKEPSDQTLDPRAELLLFYAARIQLLQHIIFPALARGAWVLTDRFELSSFAYQGGGRQLDRTFIQHLSQFCLQGFRPDLTIFLDISPELGLERAASRGNIDRIEQESIDFFHAVHAQYQHELQHYSDIKIIDASQPLSTVQQAIRHALTEYLHHVVN